MTKYPTLSVIIPNYNHGHYLKELVLSLVSQSRPPDEIIIVDDASTDESRGIIEELTKQNSTIRFFRNKQNQGVVRTLNNALNQSVGDYVTFPSADNFVLPGMYEKSMAILNQHPQAGLCCSDPGIYDQKTGSSHFTRLGLSKEARFFSPEEVITLCREKRFCVGNMCHTIVVKRDAMKKAALGGEYYIPKLKWHCDFFAANVVAFRHGVCYIPKPLAMFRVVSESYSTKHYPWKTRKAIYSHILDLLDSPHYCDVQPHFRRSSILAELTHSMLLTLITKPSMYKHFTPLFIKRSFYSALRRAMFYWGTKIPYARTVYRLLKNR